MTQDFFDRINRLVKEQIHQEKEHKEICALHEAAMESLKLKIHKLHEKCDHIYPDGTSAVEDGFFASVCKICLQSDM